ncbi:MAG: serine/threonine protein kinase [Gallionella sp.]|nr:serine/threonine protein kinase [Gallionella sp.]
MPPMQNSPYSELDPDAVLDALEHIGMRCDGRLLTLNSYENRVFQVGMEDGPPLVAKFYRAARWSDEAILEEHRYSALLAEREIPVVSPLNIAGSTLHNHQGYRYALFNKQGGRAPELDRPETLQWMGRFIARIHAVGALDTYQHRPTLDINSFGIEPCEFLLAHNFISSELREVYKGVVAHALDGVRRCFDRAGAVRTLRLHGDCHVGNVLWTEQGPHFVDFDDSRMGPAIQDLWMLLSGDRAEQTRQFADLLIGYEDFYDFDTREMHLLEALRTLRLIHYSAWIARRWDDAAFKVAFPWFDSQRYWQDRILELREQIALMDEPPLPC